MIIIKRVLTRQLAEEMKLKKAMRSGGLFAVVCSGTNNKDDFIF